MAILQTLKHQFFDSSGNPLSGGKLYAYVAGTSTPKDTYTDQGGLTANANPVILDSRGEASIWFNGSYKVVLKTAADATIWTVDNIQDPATGFVTLTGIETLTNKTLTSPSMSSPTITGAGVVTGSLAPSGAGTITATNLSGGQIAFPSTQVPSADPNTLDDYEEGTWTPSVGGTATYTIQIGRYTKIGRVVIFDFELVISSIGTGSQTEITGLPFAPMSGVRMAFPVSFIGSATAIVGCSGTVFGGSSTITLYSTTAAATTSQGTSAILTNGTTIRGGAVFNS